MSLRFPPHQGQVRTSISKTRFKNTAQVALDLSVPARRVRPAAGRSLPGRTHPSEWPCIQSRSMCPVPSLHLFGQNCAEG